jgi:protein ImuA
MSNAGRALALSELRERIERLEHGRRPRAVLPFRVRELDQCLPAGGLALGGLHEVMQAGAASEHAASATLFAAGILARNKGPVLWCLRRRDLFAPALAAVGLHPDRVIYAETRREPEILATMEEGLRHNRLGGVVGEVARLGLTASRRLQLAAEESGVPALVIRRWRNDLERALADEPTAAVTRWRVSAVPSRPLPVPGIGRERWLVELIRCKGGEPRTWLLESCDAKGRLALPSDLADRSLPQEHERRAAA